MRNVKVSVLIVDDHPSFVERMVSLIKDSDTSRQISTAHNYEDAIQVLSSQAHEVVLLDISMPGRNGIELLEEIRRRDQKCTIIMLSNLTAGYYRQECKRLGASYFLDKSAEFDQIPGIIHATQLHLN